MSCSVLLCGKPMTTNNQDGEVYEEFHDNPICKMNDAKSKANSSSSSSSEMGVRQALLYLVAIFLMSVASLAYVYANFPELEKNEYQYMKLPRDIDDAKNIGRVLSHYKEQFYLEVLSGVLVVYIFLQTFAIPGSIFLSILCGFLFRWEVGLLLVCFCSATGASFCYLLSFLVGRPLVARYIPDRVAQWQKKVDKHGDNLFFYVVFLRITPFLPNWFINIASPVLNVPLTPFWLGTFVGVAPPSLAAIQAGTALYKLTSAAETFSFGSIVMLVCSAVLSLIPIVLKSRLQKKFD